MASALVSGRIVAGRSPCEGRVSRCALSLGAPVRSLGLPRATAPGVRLRNGKCRAQQELSSPPVSENGAVETSDGIPTPIIKIDNQHDPFATIVTIEFGDRLGQLLDTIAALKSLRLNIRRAKIEQSKGVNKFYITDAFTSEKILKSARLEEIRLTILNNLMKYHPESGSALGWGSSAVKDSDLDALHPLGAKIRSKIKTHVEVVDVESGNYSLLKIKTRDRPGLLTDIVKVLKDISVNVVSAEVDTEGAVAIDEFYVTYHGEALNPSMTLLVVNTLSYTLGLFEVEREESY